MFRPLIATDWKRRRQIRGARFARPRHSREWSKLRCRLSITTLARSNSHRARSMSDMRTGRRAAAEWSGAGWCGREGCGSGRWASSAPLRLLVSGDTYSVISDVVQLLMSLDTNSIFLTAGQMKAARSLLGVSGERLAEMSGVSLVAIRRAEAGRGASGMMRANAEAIRRALEEAGIEFIPENGGGAGVRLRERSK